MSTDDVQQLSEEAAITRVRAIVKKKNISAEELTELIYDDLVRSTLVTMGPTLGTKDTNWMIIDLKPDAEFILVRDGDGNTIQYDAKEEALAAAEKYYGQIDDKLVEEVIVKWPVWSINFAKGDGDASNIFPIDEDDDDLEDMESRISRAHRDGVTKKLRAVFYRDDSPMKTGAPLHNEPASSLEDFRVGVINLRSRLLQARVEHLRRVAIPPTEVNENWGLFNRGAWVDRVGKGPGSPSFPVMSSAKDLKPRLAPDYHLARLVLKKLEKIEWPTVAEVLATAQKWRYLHPDINAEEVRGAISPTGQSVRAIIEDMIGNQFDIQLLFDDSGEQYIGALELRTVTEFVARRGWDKLPERVDEESLKSIGIWSPPPPTIHPSTPLDRVMQFLLHGMDAVLFEWNPKLHSSGVPETVSERLAPGLHIFTSHDVLAWKIQLSIEDADN